MNYMMTEWLQQPIYISIDIYFILLIDCDEFRVAYEISTSQTFLSQ